MNRSWLVLIMSLPTHNATARMRVWRALKALGCGVLRDGVYLLPDPPRFRQMLEAQAEDIKAGGGSAYVLEFNCAEQAQQQAFEGLFDRSDEYARLLQAIRQFSRELQSAGIATLQRRVGRLRKEFSQLAALDFFPNEAREQAALALDELEQDVFVKMSPDEPHAVQRSIQRLNRADYQGHLWATRARPWIDRLVSAWLIRRFIDPAARFQWLATPADCPPEALGFDFDGAVFTHVGGKVTFEVLLTSFGLTNDRGLDRLAGLVHYLDAGGVPVLEAPGLAALIRGMQQRFQDDDQLLTEAEKVFDSFYSFYLDFAGPDT